VSRWIRIVCRAWGLATVGSVAAVAAGAQDAHFYYPAPPPGSVTITSDVPYAAGDTAKLRMDVYRPSGASSTASPALIFFNGTGLPRKAEVYAGWGRTAASKGLVAIVPDLRPDSAAQDFQRLLTYLAAHAAAHGIDRAAMVLYAASANVHTAFPIVEDPKQTAIVAAVMYYGTAPVTQFRRDLPVLYVRAGLDRPDMTANTPSSILGLATLAISQNAPLTLLNNAAGHHAFEIVDDDAATRDVIDRTIDWVKRAAAPPYQDAIHHGVPEATIAAQVATGDAKAAVAGYADLVRARPDDARLRLSYAEALLGDRQFESACAQFDRLKGKGLGPRDLGLPAARACMQNGDTELAIGWLRSIPPQFLPPEVQDDPIFASLKMRAEFRALFPAAH
jgi:hypothetical protein